jgi:ABC-type Na+ efflux pump permease subunit
MEKKIATYLLGVAMGIIIMAFLNVLIFDTNTNEKALLDLKKSYESLLEEKNNLQAQLDLKADETDDKEANDKETKEQAEAEIVINQNDSHDKIADKLVESKIYPHKNDIMLILEILEYDKLEAEKYLVDYGIVPKHTNALKLYDEKSLRIREVLAKEKVIVDEDAFEKFQYMIDRSTKIKPGTKSFKVNSSLREIVDVLSN